jgi:hypothetical protein
MTFFSVSRNPGESTLSIFETITYIILILLKRQHGHFIAQLSLSLLPLLPPPLPVSLPPPSLYHHNDPRM